MYVKLNLSISLRPEDFPNVNRDIDVCYWHIKLNRMTVNSKRHLLKKNVSQLLCSEYIALEAKSCQAKQRLN